MLYLMRASILGYAKAYADLSSDAFSNYFPDEHRIQMRETATGAGAKLPSYISYFDKKEFNDALSINEHSVKYR